MKTAQNSLRFIKVTGALYPYPSSSPLSPAFFTDDTHYRPIEKLKSLVKEQIAALANHSIATEPTQRVYGANDSANVCRRQSVQFVPVAIGTAHVALTTGQGHEAGRVRVSAQVCDLLSRRSIDTLSSQFFP